MNKALKIVSLISALVLICFILFFASAFMGNPLSKFLASSSSKKYIEDKYSNLSLDIDKPYYSFKTGDYTVRVSSPASIDTHFYLSYDGWGKLTYDSYTFNVLELGNTYNRINYEYFEMVKGLGENGCPYDTDIFFGNIAEINTTEIDADGNPIYEPFGIDKLSLTLDGTYNVSELGKTAGHITAYIESEEISSEKAAEILLGLTEYLEKNNAYFYAIDFNLTLPKNEDGTLRSGEQLSVKAFLRSDIYEDGLIKRIERADAELREYYKSTDKMKKP